MLIQPEKKKKKKKITGGRGGCHQVPQGIRNPLRFGEIPAARGEIDPALEGSAICPGCFSSPRSLGCCQGRCRGCKMPDKQSFGAGQSLSADYLITCLPDGRRALRAPRDLSFAPEPGILEFSAYWLSFSREKRPLEQRVLLWVPRRFGLLGTRPWHTLLRVGLHQR